MPRGNENSCRQQDRWTEGAGPWAGVVSQFSSGHREHTPRCWARLALGWHWPPPCMTSRTLRHRPRLPSWAGRSQESRKASLWVSLWTGLPRDDTEAPTTPGIGVGKVMLCASPYPDVTWRQPCLPRSYCGGWGTSPSRRGGTVLACWPAALCHDGDMEDRGAEHLKAELGCRWDPGGLVWATEVSAGHRAREGPRRRGGARGPSPVSAPGAGSLPGHA